MTDPFHANKPGVGVVVRKRTTQGDRVLLVRRGKAPQAGRWSIPGGHQELGETVRQTAAREVLEETGLEVAVAEFLDVIDAITPDGRGGTAYHYTLIDFAADWIAGEPVAGSDAADVAWADPNDLDRFDLWRETRRVIALAFSPGRDAGS